jgi:hypothetical protein
LLHDPCVAPTRRRPVTGDRLLDREYTNVYLDKVEPAPAEAEAAEAGDTDPEEAAWRTAVDAAPWLVGEADRQEKTAPDELYEKLKPFKEKVAEDIKDDSGKAS